MERDYTDSQQNESQNINQQSSNNNTKDMLFIDKSPEAVAAQQLQQGINNSEEVQEEMEWQNEVNHSERQRFESSSPQQNNLELDNSSPKDKSETEDSPLSMDLTRISFELIDWDSMDKKSFPLKKGIKMSIYKLVKKMGWPTDKATHAHIINYIRNYAAHNQHLQLIDNNYLLNSSNQPLEIPSFRSYIAFFKKNPDPKFQQFYHEELGRYGYPPLITNIENQLYHITVNYTNPCNKSVLL